MLVYWLTCFGHWYAHHQEYNSEFRFLVSKPGNPSGLCSAGLLDVCAAQRMWCRWETTKPLLLEKYRHTSWSNYYVARKRGCREACIGFWWGNLRERDHWGDPGIDGRIILRWIFGKWDLGVWTGLGWLRIETGSRQLWMRLWTFGFNKMWGISWIATNPLASQEGLYSME
jgi:hypothetical protein